MAPFGPVLDMVAKLNSTKSFCWLKEKIVITTVWGRGAHQAPGVPHPQFHITSASPLALKDIWASTLRRIVQIKALSSQPCGNLLSISTLSLQADNSPPRPLTEEMSWTTALLLIYSKTFLEVLLMYTWEYLSIQTVLILHQKRRKSYSYMNSSVVRKQLSHI